VPPEEVPPSIEDSEAGENPPPFEKGGIEGGFSKRMKYILGDVTVYVVSERVQYYGPEGKLITESLKDYTRSTVRKNDSSLDDFLRIVNE
jgi:type I restriction enzyme R subunit